MTQEKSANRMLEISIEEVNKSYFGMMVGTFYRGCIKVGGYPFGDFLEVSVSNEDEKELVRQELEEILEAARRKVIREWKAEETEILEKGK